MGLDEHITEEELSERIANGDQLAFRVIFRRHYKALCFFGTSITQDAQEAEDLVQDIFEKLWKDRDVLREIDSFQGYVFRMAQNAAINGFKRMALEVTILKNLADQPQDAPHSTPQASLTLKETQERLHWAIQQLPPQQKMVYLLSREEGIKHEEIARRLHITTGTVKNHMIQALRNLRKQLQHYPNTLDTTYLVIFLLSLLQKNLLFFKPGYACLFSRLSY